MLVDRKLRAKAVAVNRANLDLQLSHVEGSGHEYWVDAEAGFDPRDQADLIQFLLSLDDDPAMLSQLNSSNAPGVERCRGCCVK